MFECKWCQETCELPRFLRLCTSDIFCVCETHTDNSDIVDINNHTFIAKNRSRYYKRKSGGIGVYVRNDIEKYVNVIENDSDYVFLPAD